MAGDCGYKRKGRKGRSGMKKVSVIIPAYRCAATLRQAIDSALFQEVPLEILVLDDCSGEDIEGIVRSYGDEKPGREAGHRGLCGVSGCR